MPPKNKWIQQGIANPKTKGALHRQLGYKETQKIPKGLMHEIYNANIGTTVRGHKVTPLLKHRVLGAVNAQKRRR